MFSRLIPLILSGTFLFAGCAPITQNQLASRGVTPLAAKQIFDLVSGNTLYLEAIDFNSHMYFLPDGTIAAHAESVTSDDSENGGWDINGENQLCLKFKVWYYGEMKCYSVYPDAEAKGYALFLENGALAYTAKPFNGDAAHLYKSPAASQKKTYLRETLASGQSATTAPVAATPPPAQPTTGTTYLRESLAAGQSGAVPQESVSTTAAAGEKNSESAAVPDAEIQHTVKSMAKNCPGCKLEKSDLRQADLVGANLKGANLKGADLSRANLRRANLEGANLRGAILLSANMPGANLKGADLTEADFTGANLIQADLTGAKTENAILTNTHLEGVKGLK